MERLQTIPNHSAGDQWLSAKQLATYLGVSDSKAWDLIKTGQIPSVKIGRSRRVSTASIVAFLSASDATPDTRRAPVRSESPSSNSEAGGHPADADAS